MTGIPMSAVPGLAPDVEGAAFRGLIQRWSLAIEAGKSRFGADLCGDQLKRPGFRGGSVTEKIWPDFNPLQRLIFRQGIKMSIVLGAAIHECGGARMGTDPRTSIMNRVNQLWDVPNVFVPDASSFVSSSTVGPALTIMALAARTSAFVADRLADGDLRETTADATV